MDKKIEKFLKTWNEMLEAMNEIKEFDFELSISITSDNRFAEERVKTINGINECFNKHDMEWRSDI